MKTAPNRNGKSLPVREALFDGVDSVVFLNSFRFGLSVVRRSVSHFNRKIMERFVMLCLTDRVFFEEKIQQSFLAFVEYAVLFLVGQIIPGLPSG